VWVTQDLDWLYQRSEWQGLASLVMVVRRWEDKGGSQTEKRYYISSLRESPERLATLIRRHWSIENELHWHLDVTLGEDASQVGPEANENLRVARLTALEMLRAEKTFKMGLKAKMRKCHRSDDYLYRVLFAGNF
jgi:predicted transposase YbfD/YdcC